MLFDLFKAFDYIESSDKCSELGKPQKNNGLFSGPATNVLDASC